MATQEVTPEDQESTGPTWIGFDGEPIDNEIVHWVCTRPVDALSVVGIFLEQAIATDENLSDDSREYVLAVSEKVRNLVMEVFMLGNVLSMELAMQGLGPDGPDGPDLPDYGEDYGDGYDDYDFPF